MNDGYDLLIIGATFTGLGIAYECKDQVLIIERTSQVGYEFINSYQPGTLWNETELSSEGEKLQKELLQREILTKKGFIHLPALAPVLYHRIKEDHIPIMLMTEIVQIIQQDDVYEVEIYNATGLSKIKVHSIIETTFHQRLHKTYKPRILSKSINAMLVNVSSEYHDIKMWNEKASIILGKFLDEVIVKLEVDKDEDWIGARGKIHKLWAERPDSMKPWLIAAVANYFAVSMEKGLVEIDKNRGFLPSCAYHNPLEAFEAGIQYGVGRDYDAIGTNAE